VVDTTYKEKEKTVRLVNNKLINNTENLLADRRYRYKNSTRPAERDKALNMR
jgi:hypothetical protein